MATNIGSQVPPAPVPALPSAALIRSRIVERRCILEQHNPAAVDLAAAVLSVIHEAAYGHASALRADRTARYRDAQLMGEKPLAVEDLTAVALENAHGRVAVLDGLRVLAQGLGYELRPISGRVERLHEAVALSMEGCSSLWAGVSRACADGRLEPHEAASLEPVLAEAQERLTSLRVAMQRASSEQFYRPTRATKVTA